MRAEGGGLPPLPPQDESPLPSHTGARRKGADLGAPLFRRKSSAEPPSSLSGGGEGAGFMLTSAAAAAAGGLWKGGRNSIVNASIIVSILSCYCMPRVQHQVFPKYF